MPDVAFQHVGHGLDAAVRMRGKAGDRPFARIVEGKVIEQQERIEGVLPARPEGPAQQDAGSLDHHLRLDDLLDCPKARAHLRRLLPFPTRTELLHIIPAPDRRAPVRFPQSRLGSSVQWRAFPVTGRRDDGHFGDAWMREEESIVGRPAGQCGANGRLRVSPGECGESEPRFVCSIGGKPGDGKDKDAETETE